MSTPLRADHVRNALTMLQLRNKAQLVRYALENGADLAATRGSYFSALP